MQKTYGDVLKDNKYMLIGGGKTVSNLFMTMTSTNVTNLGALTTTHPPSNSFFEQLRKREVFLTTNQKRWSKKPKEDQKAGHQEIQDMYDMCADLKSELANLGYALRRHNARYLGDREKQIIIQDVVRDWIEFRYDLSIERAAPVTQLQTMVMLSSLLHAWLRTLKLTGATWPMRHRLETNLEQLPRALDIPNDIWAMGGYRILLSDNGAYSALSERTAAFSLLRNYLTTTSETQGAQGSAVAAGHINGWDRPLLPRDDRPLGRRGNSTVLGQEPPRDERHQPRGTC